jgi:hypothetical protein
VPALGSLNDWLVAAVVAALLAAIVIFILILRQRQ